MAHRDAEQRAGHPTPGSLATIFDPLVRVPSESGARRPGSTGLGTYIAREIVVAHGGAIELESSQAAGTTFTVRLPGLPSSP